MDQRYGSSLPGIMQFCKLVKLKRETGKNGLYGSGITRDGTWINYTSTKVLGVC